MEGSFVSTSKNGVNCSGDETNITACSLVVENTNRECGVGAASIRCFNIGTMNVSPECSGSTEVTDSTSSSPTTVAAMGLTQTADGSDFTATTSHSSTQSMATADMTEATQAFAPNKSFFTPPTLYYLIGMLAAIVIAAVLLVLVFLLTCCCCYYRMRNESGPHSSLERDSTNPISKDSLQLPPIYESILSNENTTIHESQGTTVPSTRNQFGTSDNPAYGVGEATSCSDNPAYGVGEACSCSDNPAYGTALAEYVTVLV